MDKYTTPGPWIVGTGRVSQLGFGRDEYFAVGIQSDAQLPNWLPVAILSRADQVTDMDRANASLIAAAPDLLAALREAADMLDVAEFPEGAQAVEHARAAIARAEGRT